MPSGTMQQQRLNFNIPVSYTYGSWIRHSGVEHGCNRIALWLVQGGMLWLNSDGVAGKTHFLHALKQEHPHAGLVLVGAGQEPSVRLVEGWLRQLEPFACWMVDLPAGPVSRACGLALFHLIERAREMNRSLLISWRCGDDALAPAELSSRMRMMEQATMAPPSSDQDMRAIIHSVADELQWSVKESVVSLMLSQLPRTIGDQVDALKQLESAALEDRRRITRIWAKEKLKLDRNSGAAA
ncbi:MAG: hypothetical protein RQ867_03115 [Mariprofundaceae bacterium]|nr:hypothetical protein [Mariprofundaceae bacterium]